MSVHRELEERLARARLGGSEAARDKQKAAGRLLVRERLALLLDGEPDFEDGLLARCVEGLAGDAVVTVIGRVDGRPVAVIANDFTVKAGTWGRRTFEKITQLQERADALGIPVVYLVDAAGARIDEQFDSYAGRHAWGNIFTNLVRFSGRVPQVCVLFGPSPAGSAYVPALCDVVIMVRGHATAYIGSPRLAEMVTGERVSLEEGVYAALLGPSFETPAEIRMLQRLGADAVGMSTAREAQQACDLGLECAAVSLITNRAAGLSDRPIHHEEVLEMGKAGSQKVGDLLESFLRLL